MNEMNELEKQLRGWTPRRPSAGIERHLGFLERSRRKPEAYGNGHSWAVPWIAPATACFLFACLLLNQHGAASFADADGRVSMVGVILSNQSYAAYLPGSFQRANNRLDTFEWTKGSNIASPVPLSPVKTND